MAKQGQEKHLPWKVWHIREWQRGHCSICFIGQKIIIIIISSLLWPRENYENYFICSSYSNWPCGVFSEFCLLYTVVGVRTDPVLRGVIPNSFEHIFTHIARTQNQQYLVRSSYLEIYQVPTLFLLVIICNRTTVPIERARLMVQYFSLIMIINSIIIACF